MTRIVKKNIFLNTHRGKINLVALGDIHRASRNCDLEKLFKVYDWIKKHNCFVIGMGDYSEWITPKDRRYNIKEYHPDLVTPDDQFDCIKDEFESFKEKIICLLDGNHDFNYYQKHHHNYVDSLAHELGTDYGTYDAAILLRFSLADGTHRKTIKIYAHHGWSNSRTIGGKAVRLQDLSQIFPKWPLYLMGHTHLLGAVPPKISLDVDRRGDIVEFVETSVFTGSFLKGYEAHKKKPFSSYVARKTYNPLSLGAALIEVQPFRRGTHKSYTKINVKNIP